MKKTIALLALILLCTSVFAGEYRLPPELKNADKSKIFHMKPPRGRFSVEDPKAEGDYTNRKTYPADHNFGENLSVSYLMPKQAVKWGKGPKIPYNTLSVDKYCWIKWGTNAVVPGTAVVLNNDWGKALDIRNIDRIGTNKKAKYTMFLRVKIQGPAFSTTSEEKENSISLDKLVFFEN